jgi:NADPH:quinone reductase-like Zn-dependent oxidoreductase
MATTSLPSEFKALTYTLPSTSPHLTHSPLVPPAANELLVKVKAAAINPVDIQLWGNPVIGWLAGKKEKGIGRDYSGAVVGVGSGVKGWEVGDEVFGLFNRPTGEGTFGEYIKVLASDPIARKPASWSYQTAAAVPLVALTAFSCLDWLPAETSGVKRRVVVAGASGGVGTWSVQCMGLFLFLFLFI